MRSSSSSTPIRRMLAFVALVMAAVLMVGVFDVSDVDAKKRKKKKKRTPIVTPAPIVSPVNVLVVNSTDDSVDADLQDNVCDAHAFRLGNQCTLRAAIEQANQTTATDLINFDIPTTDPGFDAATGVFTIAPYNDELPHITGTVTIDGYSQGKATVDPADDAKANTLATGSDAVLKVELSGANAPAGTNGLTIKAANSTLKGLVINGWEMTGLSISGSGATGNKVEGNYIGTDASGTSHPSPNNKDGVGLYWAPNNTVGGTTPAARNVISGNSSTGVEISGSGATGNKVEGNFIGTDASGTNKLGNSSGVHVDAAPTNTVGGTTAGARNFISGNGESGVAISGSGATGNKVEGNFIGTDASGRPALGNFYGVILTGAPNNTVGGTTAGARNFISGNDVSGVAISGSGATGNSILSNSIFSNGLMGIDLGPDRVRNVNDYQDPDSGPNNLQNYPILSSATTTTVSGTLNSTPSNGFTIQVFLDPVTDQGRELVGEKTDVSTDASGDANFTITFAGPVPEGFAITATATDNATGDTSEFSMPVAVG